MAPVARASDAMPVTASRVTPRVWVIPMWGDTSLCKRSGALWGGGHRLLLGRTESHTGIAHVRCWNCGGAGCTAPNHARTDRGSRTLQEEEEHTAEQLLLTVPRVA